MNDTVRNMSEVFEFGQGSMGRSACSVLYGQAVKTYLQSSPALHSPKIEEKVFSDGIKVEIGTGSYITCFFMKRSMVDTKKVLRSLNKLLKGSETSPLQRKPKKTEIDLPPFNKMSMHELLKMYAGLNKDDREEYRIARSLKAYYFSRFNYELYLPLPLAQRNQSRKPRKITKEDINKLKPIAKIMTEAAKRERKDLETNLCVKIYSPKTRKGKYKYFDVNTKRYLGYDEYEERMLKYIRKKISFKEEREKLLLKNKELKERILSDWADLKEAFLERYRNEFFGEGYEEFMKEVMLKEDREDNKENIPIQDKTQANRRRKSICLNVLKENTEMGNRAQRTVIKTKTKRNTLLPEPNKSQAKQQTSIRLRRRSVLLDDDVY